MERYGSRKEIFSTDRRRTCLGMAPGERGDGQDGFFKVRAEPLVGFAADEEAAFFVYAIGGSAPQGVTKNAAQTPLINAAGPCPTIGNYV
jgi:hypothetical protein